MEDFYKQCNELEAQLRKDLDDAYSRFFKHQNEEPVFKSKKGKNSFRTPYNGGATRVEGRGVKIPKLRKPISFRGSYLPKEYKLLSVTIKLTKSGKWIASLCLETEVKELPKTGKQVGVDLGLIDLMILNKKNMISYMANQTKFYRRSN